MNERAVTISVTQADIDTGERNSYYDCPVARAATRALRKQGLTIPWLTVDKSLDFDRFHYSHDQPDLSIDLDGQVLDWIELYDDGFPTMAPFQFTIRLPEAVFTDA